MRTIHWTIAASLAYNAVAASLAVAGLISPLLAAFIMPASSLTVVALALRSGAFRTRSIDREHNDRAAPTHSPRHAPSFSTSDIASTSSAFPASGARA